MELKKGMWVITNDRMEIGQIKDFCTCKRCEERGFYEPIIDNPNIFITNYDKECKFHGYKFYDNIIDLIEVGDYVNGNKVIRIETSSYPEDKNVKIIVCCGNDDYYFYYNEDIKSVVTKEMFDSIKYEVK